MSKTDLRDRERENKVETRWTRDIQEEFVFLAIERFKVEGLMGVHV